VLLFLKSISLEGFIHKIKDDRDDEMAIFSGEADPMGIEDNKRLKLSMRR
jgi:hypothetical protein